jgi:hypothetical protein
MHEIDVKTVKDLQYVYDDPILLKEIEDYFSKYSFEKFIEVRNLTVLLSIKQGMK